MKTKRVTHSPILPTSPADELRMVLDLERSRMGAVSAGILRSVIANLDSACNAHDELVAALRELVNTADDAHASWLRDCEEGTQVPDDLVRLGHSARFARAALRLTL